jgi:hypothetical protein
MFTKMGKFYTKTRRKFKCRHLFFVLTSGPMTVSAQRGTCHMRTGCRSLEVKTQKCMLREKCSPKWANFTLKQGEN